MRWIVFWTEGTRLVPPTMRDTLDGGVVVSTLVGIEQRSAHHRLDGAVRLMLLKKLLEPVTRDPCVPNQHVLRVRVEHDDGGLVDRGETDLRPLGFVAVGDPRDQLIMCRSPGLLEGLLEDPAIDRRTAELHASLAEGHGTAKDLRRPCHQDR